MTLRFSSIIGEEKLKIDFPLLSFDVLKKFLIDMKACTVTGAGTKQLKRLYGRLKWLYFTVGNYYNNIT